MKHAAVCVTLALLEKAADDYDALEALGENVTAKRNELADLVKDTTGADMDAENSSLPPDTADADTTDTAETPENPETVDTAEKTETKETPDSKETAADSKQEQAASSKEEAAPSKEEQPVESEQTKTPAVQEVKSYIATETYAGGNTDDDTITYTEKVTYQIGGNTLKMSSTETEEYSYGDGQHKETESHTDTYTLSQPLQGMERHGQWKVVWDVPAGTTITRVIASSFVRDGETISSENTRSYPLWYVISDRILNDWQDVQNQMAATGDLSKESVTIEKGNFYVLITMGEGGETLEKGGFIFRGV